MQSYTRSTKIPVLNLVILKALGGRKYYWKQHRKVEKYLNLKLNQVYPVTQAISLNGLCAEVMIVMNLTRKGRTPSALHIIMTNLFPVNIQFLQSFQHFGHYFSWMCSRLTQNKEMLNREVGRRKRTYGDNMRLDYLKPKSPFPLSWKMRSQPNWRLHKYLLTIPTC